LDEAIVEDKVLLKRAQRKTKFASQIFKDTTFAFCGKLVEKHSSYENLVISNSGYVSMSGCGATIVVIPYGKSINKMRGSTKFQNAEESARFIIGEDVFFDMLTSEKEASDPKKTRVSNEWVPFDVIKAHSSISTLEEMKPSLKPSHTKRTSGKVETLTRIITAIESNHESLNVDDFHVEGKKNCRCTACLCMKLGLLNHPKQ
jgi:hypothetical protein